jgi:UDP-N-acetylmuramoyl-L-alanyl-D-glutamate--2,6-diaminopimelate ligase
VSARLPKAVPSRVTALQVADPRELLARVAQRFYGFPDRALGVIGVTGSRGKTSVAHLLRHFLGQPGGQRVGLISSIHYDLGARTVPAYLTTPEALDTFGLLAQMRDSGCREAVVEVSAQGIDQQRVLGVRFGAVVFTHLAEEAAECRRDLASCFDLKSRLFTGELGVQPGVAVVNLDDLQGTTLMERIPAGVRVVTFGESPAAEVRAEAVECDASGARFCLVWPSGRAWVSSPLIGRPNVSNLLAAVATLWALGRDPAEAVAAVLGLAAVPGRMEPIRAGQRCHVVVDAANAAGPLAAALATMRAGTSGRVIVVVGAAGDRERSGRAALLAAAQRGADFVIATADNPRTEGVGRVFADLERGVTEPARVAWIEDRRRAIALALDMAGPADAVLIAGRGHDGYQEMADTIVPFDDRRVARTLLAMRGTRVGG